MCRSDHRFFWVYLDLSFGTMSEFLTLFTWILAGNAKIADTSCISTVGEAAYREARQLQSQITGNVSMNSYRESILAKETTLLRVAKVRKIFEVLHSTQRWNKNLFLFRGGPTRWDLVSWTAKFKELLWLSLSMKAAVTIWISQFMDHETKTHCHSV